MSRMGNSKLWGKITVLFAVCGWGLSAQGKYSAGTGEPNDPYRIANAEDLNDIGNYEQDWDKHFILVNDVNLAQYTGTQFNIIGKWFGWEDPNNKPFTGVFDGNDHKIWSFTCDSNGINYVGLFKYVGEGGQIKNLGLENVDVNTVNGSYIGGLCGRNVGTISGCYATGNVRVGDNFGGIGGLCGWNLGTISDCFATGAMTGVDSSMYFGGLCGYNDYDGTISNCYATGTVTGGVNSSFLGGLCGQNFYGTISGCYATGTVSGGSSLGGLCGGNGGTIVACYATGPVTGGDDSGNLGGLCGGNGGTIRACNATGKVTGGVNSQYVGGLVGLNGGAISTCNAIGTVIGGNDSFCVGGLCGVNRENGTISACNATGTVTGRSCVGGLCGDNWSGGTISRCNATGAVTGGDNSVDLGGLCGRNWGSTISACYATGAVTGGDNSWELGGLCGRNYYGTISACYATGAVSSGVGFLYIGGLCGRNYNGTISACFWDIQTSDCNTSDGGTPKRTAEMKTLATFTDAGWDFIGETANGTEDIWAICEGTNYPRFVYQIPQGDIVCPDGVNSLDFALLARYWHETGCGALDDCDGADIDLSGVVDFGDVVAVAESWLRGVR